jgi:hypothetical protein
MSADPTLAARPIGLLVKMFPKLSETFVLEEVLGLERLGVPLRLYTLAAPSDDVAHPAVAQVRAPVVQVPVSLRADAGRLAWRHLRLLAQGPWRYVAALRAAAARGRQGLRDFARAGWLAGQMHHDGVAHLHTHFISSPADVAELVSAMSGVPFSISAHAKDIYLARSTDLRRKMNAARFTVTCTEFNCRTLRRAAPQASVHRMYHGIDAGVFHPSRRAVPSLVPLLLSVGRLREKKGLDTLIEACRLLQRPRRALSLRDRRLRRGTGAPGCPDRSAPPGRPGAAHRQAHPRAGQRSICARRGLRAAQPRGRRRRPRRHPQRAAGGHGDGRAGGGHAHLRHPRGRAAPPQRPARRGGRPGGDGRCRQLLIDAPALGAQLGREARRTVTTNFDNDHNLRVVLGLLEGGHAHDEAPCAVA